MRNKKNGKDLVQIKTITFGNLIIKMSYIGAILTLSKREQTPARVNHVDSLKFDLNSLILSRFILLSSPSSEKLKASTVTR
jgi:hypothetical protein